jgi:uncharacterized protein (TIGR02145 family)
MNKRTKNQLAIIITVIVPILTSCIKDEVPLVEVPKITTTDISNITATTATSGGNITDEGSSTVLTRGVCWSTGTTPTIIDSKTDDGAGVGSFSSNIIDLFGGTTYFVRAYATNSTGTGYGMGMSFKTSGQPPSAPSASTHDATYIEINSAYLNGTVNANYYSTTVSFDFGETTSYSSTIPSPNPIIGGTDNLVYVSLTGLKENTIYHYRIKAVNLLGTTYGNDLSFKTLGLPPTAKSEKATNQTFNGAILNGKVNANYFSTVATFEYGTTDTYGSIIDASQNPIIGHEEEPISVSITGLSPGTVYHYRVKAVNSLGTTFGGNITFTTLGGLPVATIQKATNITTTSAVLHGTVNANYLTATVHFEYGTTNNYGSSILAVPSNVTGFSSTDVSQSISGLAPLTTYHYRIKSENSFGIIYSNDMTVNTTGMVNDIDGNTYNAILIGTQVWMQENLKTTKFNDGIAIPLVTSNTSWASLTTPGYSWYNNDASTYKSTYGALYNWYVISTGKLCPSGWHVPTDAEWTTLTTYLGGESVAGGKLKEASLIHWITPNAGATNETGFTALPGGNRDNSGPFSYLGSYGYWWSSTEYTSSDALLRMMYYSISEVGRGGDSRGDGFSVRCIQDF